MKEKTEQLSHQSLLNDCYCFNFQGHHTNDTTAMITEPPEASEKSSKPEKLSTSVRQNRIKVKYLVNWLFYKSAFLLSFFQGKSTKQKPLSSWTVDEVLHWLKKHIGEGYYIAYNSLFKEHEITGATLTRCNENTLIRMGIDSSIHRWVFFIYSKPRILYS